MSAFLYYCEQDNKKEAYKANKPNATSKEITAALRVEYKALSPDMAATYETKATAAFKTYENEMRIYKPRLKPQNEKEIGQPCKVYYEHEDTWFLGRVAEYDAQNQQHKVVYVHNGKPEWVPGMKTIENQPTTTLAIHERSID